MYRMLYSSVSDPHSIGFLDPHADPDTGGIKLAQN
jgi:hypothetical protein